MSLLIVDGDDGHTVSVIAQHVAAHLENAGSTVRWTHRDASNHPLTRAWRPDRYRDHGDYEATLRTQWRNFALLARSELAAPELDYWVLDGGVLSRGLAAQLPTLDSVALLAELTAADPALLLLRGDAGGHTATDRLFAEATAQRVLVNASRSSVAETVRDALGLVNADPAAAAAMNAQDLAGSYRCGGSAVRIQADGEAWLISGLPDIEPATLVPISASAFYVGGAPLRGTCYRASDGRVTGLGLAREGTADPAEGLYLRQPDPA